MTAKASETTGRPAPLYRAILRGAALGLLLIALFIPLNIYVANNLHTVVPGRIYRASQMSGPALERVAQRLGIRTVINLRGPCPDMPWYREECRATHRLGVSQEDLSFSAAHLPPVAEIRQLVEILDRTEYPILFHCFRGVDRTGLATVLALLLKTDTPLEEARRSLGLRYLHLPFGKTGNLDRFLGLYDRWLEQQDTSHRPDRLRHWLLHEYRGGSCSARMELLGVEQPGLEFVPAPPCEDRPPNGRRQVWIRRDLPIGVRVRCHNTSNEAWRLHPNDNVGTHAFWRVLSTGGEILRLGRAGRFHASVPPGSFIDLTLIVTVAREPGPLHFQAGMIEEGHCGFQEVSMELLDLELDDPT